MFVPAIKQKKAGGSYIIKISQLVLFTNYFCQDDAIKNAEYRPGRVKHAHTILVERSERSVTSKN